MIYLLVAMAMANIDVHDDRVAEAMRGLPLRDSARRKLFADQCPTLSQNICAYTDSTACFTDNPSESGCAYVSYCVWSTQRSSCLMDYSTMASSCTDNASDSQTVVTCASNNGDFIQMKQFNGGTFSCDTSTPDLIINMHRGRCWDLMSGTFLCENGVVLVEPCAQGQTEYNMWGLMSSYYFKMPTGCTEETDDNEGNGPEVATGNSQTFGCDASGSMSLTMHFGSNTCNSDFNLKAYYTQGCASIEVDGANQGMMIGCNSDFQIFTMCDSGSDVIDDSSGWSMMAKVEMRVPDGCYEVPQTAGTKYVTGDCTATNVFVSEWTDPACTNAVTVAQDPDAFIMTGTPDSGVQITTWGEDTVMLAATCRGTNHVDFYPASGFVTATSGLGRNSGRAYVPAANLNSDGNGGYTYNNQPVTVTYNSELRGSALNSDDPSLSAENTGNGISNPFVTGSTTASSGATSWATMMIALVALFFGF